MRLGICFFFLIKKTTNQSRKMSIEIQEFAGKGNTALIK